MGRFETPGERSPLQDALAEAGLSYAALARETGVSKSALGRLVLDGVWPRYQSKEKLRAAIEGAIAARSVLTEDLWTTQMSGDHQDPDEEVSMRVSLSREARQQWGLGRDPWEVRQAADVWLGSRWRYAAQALEDACQTGGFMALVGESGCGKSTVRRYVLDRLRREDRPVRVVEPVAIDRKRVTAPTICEAIIDDLAPEEKPRASLERRTRQVRRILSESSRAGFAAVMLIEEAHDLHISTLKYLKRVWEMESGFDRLIGVVLIAQPEIMTVLDDRAWAAREVVRRIEVVELGALEADEVGQFVAARLGEDVCEPDAYAACAERLSRRTRGSRVNTAWPLAVANLMTRAANMAAELGAPQVTARLVAEA